MKNNELQELGERLRASDIKTISTTDFFKLLRKATNTMGEKQLKNYLRMLRDDGYVRFSSMGVWEVIHEEKKEKLIIEKKDKPIQTNKQLDQQLQAVKKATILNPMDERNKMVLIKDEKQYKQQIYQLVDKLEDEKERHNHVSKQKGIRILWADPFEYHIVCEACYQQSPELHGRTGRVPMEQILAYKPTVCEYCGAKLEKDNDTTKE